jgi:hypothetical protein
MQISGVSLALTWPSRLCLLRVLLCAMPLLQAFPFPSTLWEVTLHPLSQACVFVYSSRGRWVFPPLLLSFPPSATLTSFPAPGCWTLPPSPARPNLFVYSSGWDSPPHPLCYVSLLFLLLITQFLFFPQVGGSVCPGGYANLAQGCLWEYRVPLSSPCGPHLPKPSGHG